VATQAGLMPRTVTAKTSTRRCEDTMTKQMSEGQRAYEAKRAAKAGVTLEKWMAQKDRDREAEARSQAQAAKPEAPKKPGLFSRLLDKAHKPL
jgi:hypothetical protein